MKPNPVQLPSDMYVPAQDAGIDYHQLEATGADARFKKMDVAYAVYLDELQRGKKGVHERVAKRLRLDADLKSSRTVIGDSIRVFETFRLGGDQGLGYTRESMTGISWNRLRAVSQNKKWALEHRDEIDKVLSFPEGEAKIREYIQSTLPENERRKVKERARDGFVSREMRFTDEEAAIFDQLVQAIEQKSAADGVTFTSENEGTLLGQKIMAALTEWVYQENPVLKEDGRPNLTSTGHLVTETILDRYFPAEDEAFDGAAQAAD